MRRLTVEGLVVTPESFRLLGGYLLLPSLSDLTLHSSSRRPASYSAYLGDMDEVADTTGGPQRKRARQAV